MWWKLLAGAATLGLIAFLVWIYGNTRYNAGELAERVRWKDAVLTSQAEVLAIERKWSDRVAAGAFNYETRIETVKPILVKNTETVERYAQTPAGAVTCLPAERVFDIEATRAALFTPAAPSALQGAGTMQAVGFAEAGGRQHDAGQ